MTPYDYPLTKLLNEITEVDPIMMKERAVKQYDARLYGSFNTEIEFTKTGEEISKSVEALVTERITGLEKVKVDIAEICKRREIDPKEVIEAGSDETAIGTYSMKAETNMGRGTSQAFIRELQEDLNNLRRYGMFIESYNRDIDNFRRVQKNIDPTGTYKLSFTELTNFGF